MIRITINLCVWCGTPHPVRVVGAEQVPPGEHQALVQISHGMCKKAERRWMAAILPDATNPVTSKKSNRGDTQR